jgi:hypothetical protein
MSTPSGKLPHLVDLAGHVARQAQSPELEQPIESGNDSPRPSPYAPKPSAERAAARLRVLANEDADDVLSAYAPKRPRLSQSGAVTSSDTSSPASASLSAEPTTASLPQDASEQVFAEDAPLAPAAIISLQTDEAAENQKNKQRSSEMEHSRTVGDREIERVEDILRELKRRELAGKWLPRGPNIPPPEAILVAPDAARSILGRRVKMGDTPDHLDSLESARLPPPPLQPMHNLRVMLGISLACVGAAVACYYFLSAPSSQPTLNSQMASLPPSSEASISTPQRASSRGPRLDREPDWAPRTSGARSDLAPAQDKKLPESGTAPQALMASPEPVNAKPESAEEQTATPSSSKAVRTLQPEELRLLVEQGERFIKDGDIVTARMIFERAAKAGDAAAALALAAAYDPIVLAKVGVLGMDTDVEKARIWYENALSLGAAQAADRLNALASR